ncbi:hypothetical protein, partial [Anaerovibrio lipolyticus]|uniref:hypothetical protein n=1 Tax=Anaerovibrio lipolyticus TaxID=82374 RepID=UPI0023EFCC3C
GAEGRTRTGTYLHTADFEHSTALEDIFCNFNKTLKPAILLVLSNSKKHKICKKISFFCSWV